MPNNGSPKVSPEYAHMKLGNLEREDQSSSVVATMENDEICLSDGGDTDSVVCLEVSSSSLHVDAQTDFLIDIDGCADAEEGNPAFRQPKTGERLDLSNVLSNTPNSSQNGGDESKSAKRGKKTMCFNCGGEHVLAACSEKRDLRRISRNRESFRSQFESMTRVHEHQPGDSGGFAPGRMSGELREALGLNRREIPEWIFRMRRKGFIDGYPPAYLKRATEKHVLPFFENNADEEEKSAGQFEDEEVIDPEKMVRYPGFNHYDRSLNDPESFRVPPWGMFIECHQRVLDDRNAASVRRREAEVAGSTPTSRKRKHNSKLGADERGSKKRRKGEGKYETPEEGEVVDDEQSPLSTTPEYVNDNHSSGKTTPDQNGVSVAQQDRDCSTSNANISLDESNGRESPGPSTSVIQGTPILLRRDIHPDKYNHEICVPRLEAFSIGINPYRHQEDEAKERSGFLDKIGGLLKSLTGKGTKKGTKSRK